MERVHAYERSQALGTSHEWRFHHLESIYRYGHAQPRRLKGDGCEGRF